MHAISDLPCARQPIYHLNYPTLENCIIMTAQKNVLWQHGMKTSPPTHLAGRKQLTPTAELAGWVMYECIRNAAIRYWLFNCWGITAFTVQPIHKHSL
jgi:hypothetical protein